MERLGCGSRSSRSEPLWVGAGTGCLTRSPPMTHHAEIAECDARRRPGGSMTRSLLLLSCSVLFASRESTRPRGPVRRRQRHARPDGPGRHLLPRRPARGRPARNYVEEEYFVSGESTLFNYANDPPAGPTDIVPIQEDVPYTTRLIVRRPADPKDFNGTVVIEWWNSTAGFDTAPAWDPSAEYFTRSGNRLRRRHEQHHVDRLPFGQLPPVRDASTGMRHTLFGVVAPRERPGVRDDEPDRLAPAQERRPRESAAARVPRRAAPPRRRVPSKQDRS